MASFHASYAARCRRTENWESNGLRKEPYRSRSHVAQPMVDQSDRRERRSVPKVRLIVQNNHALRARFGFGLSDDKLNGELSYELSAVTANRCPHRSLDWKTAMAVRGIRGAITVDADNSEEIIAATQELLEELLASNDIDQFDDIVSVIFTTTPDLTATFPAEAARKVGMNQVPLLCASEISVPGRIGLCIRVLMHVNTEKRQDEMVHVYLREAKTLRPDMNNE